MTTVTMTSMTMYHNNGKTNTYALLNQSARTRTLSHRGLDFQHPQHSVMLPCRGGSFRIISIYLIGSGTRMAGSGQRSML